MMITATVPKPSWYKERGKHLIEEYRGGRECGGSRNSVIRRLAETYNMSDEDVKQLMLDAGLPPAELPERMQLGFYAPELAGAKCRINGAPCNGCKPICDSVIVEAGDSAAAGNKVAPGAQIELAAGASPCPTSNDGEGPFETRYLQKPFPPGEGSGMIDRENVLEKLREKCQGCDNYNRVRCRWCETGRAIKIVKEAKDV